MSGTPLAEKLKARIRRDGPIRVSDYMRACLLDPEHGYYRRRQAIGADGDFVTAPEISQVFGELIGLWCAVVWRQMGSPARVNLIELGPGRGTLMRDALRATRIVPGFRDALAVHLVDSNAALRDIQRETLDGCGAPVHYHDEAASALSDPAVVSEDPAIVIANEFLDALPIEQYEFRDGRWFDRKVGLDSEGAFHIDAVPAEVVSAPRALPQNSVPRHEEIFEFSPDQHRVARDWLAARAALAPVAALFVDYGHASTGFGDTLQGVAHQRHVSPFHAPGETDLSAQVDFQRFAAECGGAGLSVDGPIPQADFLGRLGAVERVSRLMASNPAKAGVIEAGVQRLLAPTGMGSRFLALGVRSPDLAPLPALA